jgi:CRP/FNR family transcriptional regulator, cyclic AMP receptor protein
MAFEASKTGFKVWETNDTISESMPLPELVARLQAGTIKAGTWIFSEQQDAWAKAVHTAELQMFYHRRPAAAPTASGTIPPEALRRVKILAEMSDEDLARFLSFMEVQTARQWSPIVRQGERGDSMFLVLDGEVRVRLLIDNKETTLVTLGPGDFFGEVSLFDQGPRSADVIANTDAVLLKISHRAFANLSQTAPELAAPVLIGIGRTLTARIRADNKRLRDTLVLARASH